MYPIRPGNGPWSSHRPFPLSTLGPISSGNRPTPDGTFLAGTAPVNTVGTLLAAEIPGSNVYWNEPNTVTQHAFGYGGHGLSIATYLGTEIGLLLSGKKDRSPFMEIPHQTMFFYRNRPWFIPFAARYFRFLDWVS